MKMKLKKKNNKKKKVYILFLLLLYLSSFFITIRSNTKKELINYYLKNNNYINNTEDKRLVTKIITHIANVDFANPVSLINNNYKSNDLVGVKENITKKMVKLDNKNSDLKIKKEPLVYLYNTHQTEEYMSSNSELYNIKPTVMTLSYILKEKLSENDIEAIVEENSIPKILDTNNWNYASSYKASRILLESVKEENNSLKYFIDLHRDSVNRKISTVMIDDINYAKILFIVGLENDNYEQNLEVTERLNNLINNKYPNLSRGIYKKKGKGVNGVYNQDFNPNTILIEVGGEENTIDEVYNTALVITDILTEYIRNDLNE